MKIAGKLQFVGSYNIEKSTRILHLPMLILFAVFIQLDTIFNLNHILRAYFYEFHIRKGPKLKQQFLSKCAASIPMCMEYHSRQRL